MKKNLCLFFLFNFIASYCLFAQKVNNIWAFGDKAGIDFNGATPVATTNNMASEGGCASVSDRTGNLLFYTSGLQVWSRNHTQMPNGSGLLADTYALQKAVIVPFINDTNRFYIFHLQSDMDVWGNFTGAVRYSVVDMTLNGGFGDVVTTQKNVPLWTMGGTEHDPPGSGMIAVAGDNCNVWLVTHVTGNDNNNSNMFKVFEITEAGVNTTPVVSQTGNVKGPNAYLTSVMKISPDRHKLATTTFTIGAVNGVTVDSSAVELHDFDPATGIVSNSLLLDGYGTFFYNILGVEFSPDGSKLYYSMPFRPLMAPGSGGLFQMDLSLPTLAAIQASRTAVSTTFLLGDLQRAPDNKLYIGYFNSGNTFADRIDNPNAAGTACGYVTPGFALTTPTQVKTMLPAPVVYPVQDTLYSARDTSVCSGSALTLYAPSGYLYYYFQGVASHDTAATVTGTGTYWITYEDHCAWHSDTIRVHSYSFDAGLRDTALCGTAFDFNIEANNSNNPAGTAYQWQDGTAGTTLHIDRPGRYWVRMSLNGCSDTDTVTIASKTVPQFSLGPDQELCTGDQLVLTCPFNADSYSWQDGGHGRNYTVQQAGTYIVTALLDGCEGSDTITISEQDCRCKLLVPNAFSPNADGLNDLFSIYLGCGDVPVKYRISIYNRWGARVFNSYKPDQSWDGSVNGQPADAGTYFYTIDYEDRKGNPFSRKGDVALIR